MKDKIREETGNADLVELFSRVEKRLKKQVESLSERGGEVVPVTTYDKVKNNGGRFPEGMADKIRKRGVVVVKGVIPAEEVDSMVADLLKYMYDNNAFPPSTNQVKIKRNIVYPSAARAFSRTLQHNKTKIMATVNRVYNNNSSSNNNNCSSNNKNCSSNNNNNSQEKKPTAAAATTTTTTATTIIATTKTHRKKPTVAASTTTATIAITIKTKPAAVVAKIIAATAIAEVSIINNSNMTSNENVTSNNNCFDNISNYN